MTATDPRGSGNGNGTTGRKRRILIPLGIVAALVLIILRRPLSCFTQRITSATDDAQIAGDITTIAPRVKGQVIAVPVKENQSRHQRVRVLLVLDDRDYRGGRRESAGGARSSARRRSGGRASACRCRTR